MISRRSVRRIILLATFLVTLPIGISPNLYNSVLAQDAAPPLRPMGLTITEESYYSVSVSWDDPEDDSITGYQVLRRSRDGGAYGDGLGAAEFVAIKADTGKAETEYTDTTVAPKTRYVYRVKARNSAGLSKRSSYANAETDGPPGKPTGLTIASASHESITIEWNDPQDDSIAGYQVLRRSRDGDTYGDGRGSWEFAVVAGDTGTAGTQYTDSSVTAETRYVYRVKARNPGGLSERSSYANAETPAAPAAAPTTPPSNDDKENGRTPRQQQTSSDVALGSITVNGTAVPGVVPGTTEYALGLENAVSRVTLVIQPRHTLATVSYTGLQYIDADDTTEGHQVDLLYGRTIIPLRVTAQDGVATQDYTLTINRESVVETGWTVLKDLDNVLGSGSEFPGGIWSDGTLIWVSGGDDLKLYAYQLSTKERDSDRDIALDADNADPKGIWSDGETMWVVDSADRDLYAYNLQSGARDSTKDFADLGDDDADYYGIWSDGETIWLADKTGPIVEAFDVDTGEKVPELRYLGLEPSAHDHVAGIWSDGVTMLVVSRDAGKQYIWGYHSPQDEIDLDRDLHYFRLSGAGNESAGAIWGDGETLWVSDTEDNKVYSYNMRVSDNTELRSMNAAGRRVPGFDPDTHSYSLGVGDGVEQASVEGIPRHDFATVSYTPEDGDPDLGGHQVDLETGANVVTATVLAQDGLTQSTYTISINRGDSEPFGWRAFDDFDSLHLADNESPGGLASDGSTMWVADEVDLKLYAYDVATKVRTPDRDITLDPGQDSPGGMWYDGTTIRVYDVEDSKLYGYDAETGGRDEGRDIDQPGDSLPTHYGVWADQDTLWLSQDSGRLVAYDLATGTRDESRDFDGLDGIDNVDARGIWSDGVTLWVVDSASHRLRALNASTGEPDTDKDFQTVLNAGVGSARGIWSDGVTMWVSDSSADKVYSYNMPASDNTDLRKVVVEGMDASGATLDGVWYATVGSAVTQATVAATAAQLKAQPSYGSPDNDAVTDGHQLAIPGLTAEMAITVTAQNGDTSEHTLTVSRVNTSSADRVPVGGSATGDITSSEEFDVVAVDLVTDELYRFDLEGVDNGDGALADPRLLGLFKLVHGTAIPVGDTPDFQGGQGANSAEVYHEPKPAGQGPATRERYYIVLGGGNGASGGYSLSVSHQDEATAESSTTATAEVLPSSKSSGKRSKHHFRGAIGEPGDVDWIKVTLEADQMYRIVMKSATTGNFRTLTEPLLIGLYTGDGTENYIWGTLAAPYGHRSEARIHYYAESAGVYYVALRGFENDTGSYDLLVMEVEDDCQPDNTSTHDTIAVGGDKNASIDYRGDTDWFRTELTGETTYTIAASQGEGSRPLLGPTFVIYDTDANRVSSGEATSSGTGALATYTPDEDGTYYIAMMSRVGRTGTYQVSLSE